jgi:DNA-binding transcriptional MerR regulator
MKVSELSELSDVSIASIKFYLRERLLFAGTATSATRSDYDETHLARLRLIRALIEVGGLSVAAARGVLAAIDDSAMPIVDVFGIAQRAASVALTSSARPSAQPSAQPSAESLERVDRLKSERGWQTSELDPGALITARVLDTFAAIGRNDLLALLPSYAAAAEMVAHADLAAVTASGPDRRPMVETVVVGTALGDALFAGLRRIAQEDMARRLGLPGSSLSPRTTDNSSRNVER